MKHTKKYKEMKTHQEGSAENPMRPNARNKKGIRKITVRMAEKAKKYSKEELGHAHKHMKEHGG